MKKTMVMEILSSLGDEFDTEVLIERLLLMEKIEKRLNNVSENQVTNLEDVKQKFFDRWQQH
ncbi:MAG: hypothetical protein M3O71_09615 [Bacteroidota bacterium]|nr:hypothetical protein [Bacteroidota bacterium]